MPSPRYNRNKANDGCAECGRALRPGQRVVKYAHYGRPSSYELRTVVRVVGNDVWLNGDERPVHYSGRLRLI